MNKSVIIKCPYCGCEYLPEEIFYPKDIFGKKPTIVKYDGKLLATDAEAFTTVEETYCCDNCGKDFAATAKLSFTSSAIKKSLNDFFKEDDNFTVKGE